MSFSAGSVFWSILLLLVLLLLEMGFMIGLLQGVMTPLQDTFPFCKKHEKLFTGTLTYGPTPTNDPGFTETLIQP